MSEVLQEMEPEDEYSFDALELVDALNVLSEKSNEPCTAIWIRRENGMIDKIVKVSIEKDKDGDFNIYLDVN